MGLQRKRGYCEELFLPFLKSLSLKSELEPLYSHSYQQYRISLKLWSMLNHYLKVKHSVSYCLCLVRLPFSPLLLSPCPCLDGELTAVASSRACLVAAGFGCQVLGYHSHSGILVCDRLWHCTACSCEALSEVVSGQATSSMAEPLADHLQLSVPAMS